jgi:nucleotide-binding universal stress UspA family protein
MTEIARQLLNELIDDFLQTAPDPDAVMLERLVLTGIPGTRIPELARYLSAGAIVIGSSDASPWGRLFQGSVTSSVLRRAPCPVVVVNEAGDPICHRGMAPNRSAREDSRSLLGLP